MDQLNDTCECDNGSPCPCHGFYDADAPNPHDPPACEDCGAVIVEASVKGVVGLYCPCAWVIDGEVA